MKNAKILMLALGLLLLAGCVNPFVKSDPSTQADELEIYRVAASGAEEGADLIQTETVAALDGYEQEIDMALALFLAPARTDNLVCALPTGIAVEGWSLENGVVTLTLSDGFLELAQMAQTVAASCAAMTLYQLDSVEAVTIISGGQTLFSALVPEDVLLKDTDTDPYVRQLRLYFADADGRYLISEYHSLTLEEETSPERYVIEELLRGPNNSELQSAIPAGTALLSCSTTDGVCTVDLSQQFYDNRPQTAVGERLALYSIVNSLTALSTVDSVQLLVAGAPLETYVYRSLSAPLTRYDEAIGPVSTAKGEFDAQLYLALPDLQSIAAVPFRVNETDYESRAEAVLAALLVGAEPGYPNLFSGSGSVTSVDARTAYCVVELSEGFFASLDANARAVAVQSIAATLCALPEIRSVRFTIAGGEAVFEGENWSGPWYDFSQIEVQ